MDRKIKEHFDRFRNRDELPPELRESGIDARLLKDEKFLNRARNWQEPPKYHDESSDVVLRGGIDDLLRAADESIIVLDYKTRGYSPNDEIPDYYRRQVNLYNLILHENGYPTGDIGLLLYYYPSQVMENGDFIFHNELKTIDIDLDETRQFVRDAVRTIDGPIPDPDPDCDFCNWNTSHH